MQTRSYQRPQTAHTTVLHQRPPSDQAQAPSGELGQGSTWTEQLSYPPGKVDGLHYSPSWKQDKSAPMLGAEVLVVMRKPEGRDPTFQVIGEKQQPADSAQSRLLSPDGSCAENRCGGHTSGS